MRTPRLISVESTRCPLAWSGSYGLPKLAKFVLGLVGLLAYTGCETQRPASSVHADSATPTPAPAAAADPPSGYHFMGIALRAPMADASQRLAAAGLQRDLAHEEMLRQRGHLGNDCSLAGWLNGDSVRVYLSADQSARIGGITVSYIGVHKPEIFYTLRQRYGTPSGQVGEDAIDQALGAIAGYEEKGFTWCSSGALVRADGTCPLFDDLIQYTEETGSSIRTTVRMEAGHPRPPLDANY